MRRSGGLAFSIVVVVALVAPPSIAAAQDARALTGTVVAVNKRDATVSLVDLATKAISITIPVGDGPHEAAVSPDGRWALVSNYGPGRVAGNTLSLIDISQGTLEKTITLGAHRRPHGLAWLPDGKSVLVTAELDSALLLVDIARGAVTSVIPTGEAGAHLVVLTTDGARAYVTNVAASSVTMIDVAARRAVKSVPLPAGAEGIALRPDGSELWVSSRTANRITVLSADDLSVRATIESGDYPIRIRFTPDGKLALVTFARSSELKAFDAATRAEVSAIAMRVSKAAMHGARSAEGYENKTVPLGLTVSANGAWAVVANAGVDAVSVVSLADYDITAVIFVGREPDGVAYSPVVRPPGE